MTVAAVEAEMVFNGGDERAAAALVRESGINGTKAITDRAELAQIEADDAA
jgi:hypothetical protein